ncbi:hypothetical protein OH807_20915 [Kitasatospora sp. NBC_01560]|uniref:hypothetical protein n=1 Tax=Kitasatospora sp. NBC_01560 TaxID=2975965 RepID=UPI00386C169F
MAAPVASRRPGAAALAVLLTTLLAALAAALLSSCASPGGLRDHGAARTVTQPPKAVPLWPDLATAPPPTSPPADADGPPPPPKPVPDITAPGQDITAVDVRALLAKDPELGPEERRALGSCPGCEVRSPEYRDLTGDGAAELVTAVAAPGQVVLHVYRLTGDQLVPVLRVGVLSGFSAETVDTDLWVREPTTTSAQTISHYRWDGLRLALLEQKLEGIGSVPGPGTTPTAEPSGAAAGAGTGGTPTVTGRPTPMPAPATPGRATPSAGTGPVAVSPRPGAPEPARPTAARPETTP